MDDPTIRPDLQVRGDARGETQTPRASRPPDRSTIGWSIAMILTSM
jgi:hypothetical protein